MQPDKQKQKIVYQVALIPQAFKRFVKETFYRKFTFPPATQTRNK